MKIPPETHEHAYEEKVKFYGEIIEHVDAWMTRFGIQ